MEDDCNADEYLPRGTQETLELIRPWIGSHRAVCRDSHFASVQTTKTVYANGMRFIGVVKNSTKKFPMKKLGETALEGRGDSMGMTSTFTNGTESYNMLAVGWVDRNRRYFVPTIGNTNPGAEYVRLQWRKRDGKSAQNGS